MHYVQLHDQRVLLNGPLALADVWVEVVVPPLTALLTDATWEAFGNMSPVLGTVADDNFSEDDVLLLGPGSLGEVAAVIQLEPARVALDLRLAGEELADAVPGVLTKAIDEAK